MTTDAHRSRPLRFGLHTALPRGMEFSAFANSVQDAGFDVLTLPDHLVASLSPFSGATAAAAVTARLHTGTLVLNNDLRHPVDTAREAATVAAISGGRFELGLGAGHMKSEYDAAGLRFDSAGTRVDRLIESVNVIRPLLAGEPVDIDGAHYCVRADAGELVATPVVPVPLLIGGNGTRVLQLAGRVADIAGFAGFSHNSDATVVELTHFDAAGLDDRIAVVRDAAGDRFDAIELNALIQFVVHTDDFLTGLGIGFDELMGAAGDFLVEIRHGRVLLGLAVGRLTGDLSGTVVTATDQDHKYDPADPRLYV